ncbi:MAG: DNA cytosine methyltransferase [Gammaproteobacteria bacterium]|nr:DNA cytosine methyltransferase [Gammaproteobacteria bacterium]
MTVECIDLFCGVGGLTHGLMRSGMSVLAGIDNDPACTYPYEKNNKTQFIQADITTIGGADLNNRYSPDAVKVLAGCAPCQPFSTYSQSRPHDPNDQKWALLRQFGRLVEETQPDVVTMENVPQLKRHSVFREFENVLRGGGYHVNSYVVDCAEYGLPQKRSRLILLASRLGEIELIPSDYERTTVADAIGTLTKLAASQADHDDPLHVAAGLSPINLKRIRKSTQGGSWRDWPEELRAECHKRDTGKTYPGVYGRMEWDKPSPTMTTQCFGYGNGRFGHPEQDRAITLREAALLQSFPNGYVFTRPDEKIRFTPVGRLIGNAVPVRLGEVVGRSIMAHIEEVRDTEE